MFSLSCSRVEVCEVQNGKGTPSPQSPGDLGAFCPVALPAPMVMSWAVWQKQSHFHVRVQVCGRGGGGSPGESHEPAFELMNQKWHSLFLAFLSSRLSHVATPTLKTG